jgi:hypothetical protein
LPSLLKYITGYTIFKREFSHSWSAVQPGSLCTEVNFHRAAIFRSAHDMAI